METAGREEGGGLRKGRRRGGYLRAWGARCARARQGARGQLWAGSAAGLCAGWRDRGSPFFPVHVTLHVPRHGSGEAPSLSPSPPPPRPSPRCPLALPVSSLFRSLSRPSLRLRGEVGGDRLHSITHDLHAPLPPGQTHQPRFGEWETTPRSGPATGLS